MSEAPAIGIDLGTTYSVMAIYQNDGLIEIIPNQQGNRLTASSVAFTDAERLIGQLPYQNMELKPENVVYDAKRLIGRTIDDPAIQKDLKSWPFQVIDEKGQIKIKVTKQSQTRTYFPEQISAMVLENMKKAAEEYLGQKIKDVVITCPAYFNNGQRQATKDAATIAGLNVIRMINEPTAAAIAYGLKTKNVGRKNVLIFDFGGGTFDVTIIKINHRDYQVQATKGDTHLGGEDFNNCMVEYFVEQFKKRKNQDISGNKGLMRNLKIKCEQAKCTLSFVKIANFELPGTTLSTSITRACFENLCMSLFEKSINLVEECLRDAEMSKQEIQDVVLIGGSSRIPKIQELLSTFFDGKDLIKTINPDEAVAIGAAIQAAMLQEKLTGYMRGLELSDVCPLSLGTKVLNGSVATVIKRNTTIPTKKSVSLVTIKDNQTRALISIYEGERHLAKDNYFLGEFVLDEIPLAARGFQVMHTYEINADGILTVSAEVTQTGHYRQLMIVNKSRLCKRDVDLAVKEAADLRIEDENHKKRLKVWNEFEKQLFQTERRCINMSDSMKTIILTKVQDLTEWIYNNKMSTIQELQDKKYEFEEFLENINFN